jgi:BirA family biotin operon repressor/biotin-[acetyl-CoA-carboxylase] ligase
MKEKPAELNPALISRNLKTRLIGRNIIYRPVMTSTMDVAREAVKTRCAEGTIVIADEQTRGRGRRSRSWISPGGNIALSIILYPGKDELPHLVMIASLAIVHTIEHLSELEPAIKWPNDVLINGKKVAGILIESDLQKEKVNFSIVGMGINIHLAPSKFPEISSTATSLSETISSREKFLATLLAEFEILYQSLRRGKPVVQEWASRLETLGKRVRVNAGDATEEGHAEAVDGNGHLLLRRDDGSLISISAGEVTSTI